MAYGDYKKLGLDGAGGFVSEEINIKDYYSAHIQIVFSAPADGEIFLEASAQTSAKEYDQNYITVTKWAEVENSRQTVSGADDINYDITDLTSSFIRVTWVPSAGGGVADLYMFGKGEGK